LRHLTLQEHVETVPSSAHGLLGFTLKCQPKPTGLGTIREPEG
jgi:hypothetical protein